MADQKVRVNLQFTADTSQAINNMNQLKTMLNNISSNTTIGINSGSLQQAVQSAQLLDLSLEKAVNVDTGKLDLTKLNNTLKQAGTNLNTLSNNLIAVGPQGQQAFLKLATAVSQAEVPMYKMSKTLSSMGTTLFNTIKWSISSTVINAFTSSISEAVKHAKNLNAALNEIRIVTGYSADYMANFAKQASRAADALSTTTTEFSKAALIFYQQGLSGDAVLDRAETVIKLANVTGQTAQQVSDQMTSIWNNFSDGSKSLEYYADVLTKLGATTAANTTEISTAMEKFAATAEVIGLSYETAAAAVATVVAETRQSAEVVGTAYKTMFARIQGLKLGETLEDGVGLNQYSEALNKIGVKVLDTSGNMREMDDILVDLGDKWIMLSEAQKTATAQTVAGIRQYSQFMSLMENWDKILDNVKVAESSEGELTAQQEIWSESWEAASNRAKKAKDDLYESFLNDETIVKLTDGFTGIIKTIGKFIDSLGGVGPTILTIAGLFSSILFPLFVKGFSSISKMISGLNGNAFSQLIATQSQVSSQLAEMLAVENRIGDSVRSQIKLTKDLNDLKQRVALASKNMQESDKQSLSISMQLYEQQHNIAMSRLEEQKALEEVIALKKQSLFESDGAKTLFKTSAINNFKDGFKGNKDDLEEIEKRAMAESFQDTKSNLKYFEKTSAEDFIKKATSKEQEELNRLLEGTVKNQEKINEATEKLKAKKKAAQEFYEKEHYITQQTYELQKKIAVETKKKDINNLNLGTVKSDSAATTKEVTYSDDSREGAAFETMMKSTVGRATGQSEAEIKNMDLNNIELNGNIETFEKLATVQGEYKNSINVLNSVLAENKIHLNEAESAAEAKEQADKNLKNAEDELKAAEEALAKSGGKEKDAINRVRNARKTYTKALKDQTNAMERSNKAILNSQSYYSKLQTNLKKLTSSLGLTEQETEELQKGFEMISKGNVTQGLQKIEEELKKISNNANLVEGELDEFGNKLIENLVAKGNRSEAELKELKASLVMAGMGSKELEGILQLLGLRMDEIDKKINKSQGGFSRFATGISTVASQISMAIGGFQMLTGAFDEGMSSLQRLAMFCSGLAMIIPVLTGAWFKLYGVKKLENGETVKGLLLGMAEKVSTYMQATANEVETVSWWKKVTAIIATKTALSPLLIITLAFTVALAALAAIVVGITALFNTLSAAYNADANAAKEAAESVVNLEESFQSAKEAAENFKETISQWGEAITSLNELEEGTKEYAEALKNVNEQAKEIIQNNNLIKGIDWEYSDKGLIEFIEKENGKTAYEAIQEKLDQNVLDVENSLLYARINANNKQLKNNRTQKARGLEGAGVAHERVTRETATTVPLTDSEMISIINQFTNDQTLGLDDTALRQMLEAKLPESLKSLSGAITRNRSAFENLAKSTDKVVEENNALVNAYRQNLINQEYEDKAKKWTTDKKTGEVNEVKKDQALRAISTRIDQIEKDQNDEILKQLDSIDYSKASSNDNTISFIKEQGNAAIQALSDLTGGLSLDKAIDNDKELALTYAQMLAEREGKTLDRDTLTYEGGDNIGTIKDATGKELFTEVSDDVMRHELAKYAALKQIEANYIDKYGADSERTKQLSAAMESLVTNGDKLGEEYGVNFTGALLKAIEDGDGDIDFTSLFSELTPEQIEELQALSIEGWGKIFGLSDEGFQAIGYETAEAFAKQVQEGLSEYDLSDYVNQFDEIASKFSNIKKVIEDLDFGSVISEDDYNTLKKYNNEIDKYFQKTSDGYRLITTQTNLHQETIGQMSDEIAKLQNWSVFEADLSKAKWHFINEDGEREEYSWSRAATDEEYFKKYKPKPKNIVDNEITTNVLKNIGWTEDEIKSIESNNELYEKAISDLGALETASETLSELQSEMAFSAESIQELDDMLIKGDVSSYTYLQGLSALGAEYDNCSQKVEDLQQAILSGDESLINSAQDSLRSSIMLAEAAEELDIEVGDLAAQIETLSKDYQITNSQATKLAINNEKMNQGVLELNENWQDWKKTLLQTKKDTLDWSKTANQVTSSIKKLIGVSDNFKIPTSFLDLPENLQLIDKAANGSVEAINQLGIKLAEEQINQLTFNEFIAKMFNESENPSIQLTSENFETDKQTVLAGIQELQEKIKNGTLSVGQSIEEMNSDWVTSLNNMAKATGMSVKEMDDLLGSMGVETKVDTYYKKQEMLVPSYTTIQQPVYDEDGIQIGTKSHTIPEEPVPVEGYVSYAQISTTDNPLTPDVESEPAPVVYTGRGQVSSSSISTGNLNKSKGYNKDAQKSRHEYTNKQLENNANARDKISTIMDRSYGKNRFDTMDQDNNLLLERKTIIDQGIYDSNQFLETDRSNLKNYIQKTFGIEADFDWNGDLRNYEQVRNQIIDDIANLTPAEGVEMSESLEKAIEEKENQLSQLEEYYDLYIEELETNEDFKNQQEEIIREGQDQAAKKLDEKYQLGIELNDTDLKRIETELEFLDEKWFNSAEKLLFTADKFEPLNNNFNKTKKALEELQIGFENGTYSEEYFMTKSKELKESLADYAQELNALNQEMQSLVSEGISSITEEFQKQYEQISNLNSVLEHYSNILGLIGKEQDYEAVGIIREAQLKVAQDEFEVSKQWYEQKKKERDAAEQTLKDPTLTEGQREAAQTLFDSINETYLEAEEDFYTKAEALAEAANAKLENALAQSRKTLEEALTGGTSLDNLQTALDRVNARQEEYLTKTNQIYETNKMMRTVQQAMDKTDNEQAKKKYKEFNSYLKQLGEQGQLSKYELEVAQAKYDLLEAEIALEEARNAKSTVRLTRDAEGNWGYMYTADDDKISNAEQNVADKQNALYNKGLEGAQQYKEKQIQIMQEAADALQEIEDNRVAGLYATEEEYQQAKLDCQAHYNEMFRQATELYNIAAQVATDEAFTELDNTVTAHSEVEKQVIDGLDLSLEDFSKATGRYMFTCSKAYKDWQKEVEPVANVIGKSLDNDEENNLGLKQKTDAVKEASKKLAEEITKKGGLIDALTQEYNQVAKNTLRWGLERDRIYEVKDAYDELRRSIEKTLLKMSGITEDVPDLSETHLLDKEFESEEKQEEKSEDNNLVTLKDGVTVESWLGEGKDLDSSDFSGPCEIIDTDDYAQEVQIKAKNGKTAWVWKSDIKTFDTGGYTGAWGPDGKLAMLHQKELVLNANDTENFLQAVSILRSISEMLDQNALMASLNLASLQAFTTHQSYGQTLQQDVTIHAEFPNVQDHNEIELALADLVNAASQYAGRF